MNPNSFGKFYAKAFTGSLMGAGPGVFAVLSYAVAHALPPDGSVELNPALMAVQIGDSQENIEKAIAFLAAPDKASRNPSEEGRRIIRTGAFSYRLVTWLDHRFKVDDSERRAYFAKKQAEYRSRKVVPVKKDMVQHDKCLSRSFTVKEITQAEAEAEAEAERSTSNVGLLHGVVCKAMGKHEQAVLQKGYHKDSRAALHMLNEASGRSFRETDSNLGFISARLSEGGVDLDGVRAMITRQCRLWRDSAMAEFLRPQTLFNKTKFDGYYAAKDLPINTNENKNSAASSGPDRNKGTFNAGKGGLYKDAYANPGT